MSSSTYSKFSVALVTGGGGGLGKVMAKNLVDHGKKVILAGRTPANLEATAKELGPSCIATYTVEVDKIATLPAFVQKVLAEHPEVDCLINNAGVSMFLDFTKGLVSSEKISLEINTNIVALVELCNLFLPHLSKKSSSVLMNVASGLAYYPIKGAPIYCASKAFVKSFTQSLRAQFNGSNVFVVEVSPPLTESNLHREVGTNVGFTKATNPHALSQEEFIAELQAGWESGAQEVGAGSALKRQELWRNTFEAPWKAMNQMQ